MRSFSDVILAPAPVSSIVVIENVFPGVLPTVAAAVAGKFAATASKESEHLHSSLQPLGEGAVHGNSPTTCCVDSSVGVIDGVGRLIGLATAEIEAASFVMYDSTPPRRFGCFGFVVGASVR